MTGCAMGGCASLVFLQLQKREINDKGGISMSGMTS